MNSNGKILDLEQLAKAASALKRKGRRIVHCHGVFDLLHVGHIRHFQEARAMGDALIVTLTPDRFVNKGPNRPAFPEGLRAEVLASLDAVDFVAINRWPTAINTIKLIKPDFYVKGPDYKDASKDVTGGIGQEENAVREAGGKIRFTSDITFSSSNLLNKHMPRHVYDPAVDGYLQGFRKRHSPGSIRAMIDSLKNLKVLVTGEAILDEYVYCDALGKSAKEPILAMRYLSKELHAGGTLAIANHLAEFCGRVDLVCALGGRDSQEEFVRRSLRPNVRPFFIKKAESPTIVKRRYVDRYLITKMFEIYHMNDELLSPAEDRAFCAALKKSSAQCDLVISADYGHGLLTPKAVDLLTSQKRFLAVNTQINAANVGFHTISKYGRADFICIHEGEIRLDSRNRRGELRGLVEALSRRLKCPNIMVTRGNVGTLFYQAGKGFTDCPSFAVKVVDRIGAGDAVLSIASLCAAAKLPADVINFVSNLAGAQAVMIVGNSASISRVALHQSVESLLK